MRALAVTLCALVVAVAAHAAPVPVLTQRVTDQAGALSSTDASRLEQKLADYEQKTGHQFAVLIIPSLGGDVLEQYSIKVAEQWRLGDKKRDDGLLMLIAMQEHAIRIEVGYGLEGAIPDVIASRVIRDVMVPKMKAGDVAGALDGGFDALMRAAAGESIGPAPTMAPNLERPAGHWSSWLGFIAILFFVVLALPRGVRAAVFGVTGAVLGWAFLASTIYAVVFAVVGGAFGLIVPTFRGRGGGGGSGIGSALGWAALGSLGGGRSSSWGGGGGGGGFSGGGGGFGGGGASGHW